MVGEMMQNSQSLYSFTFNALIDIHEYIYSHSTTEFTFKKYIYSHLPEYFLFTIIFAHIYEMSSFTFINELYPFTFTIEIFSQHFLRITFAHRSEKMDCGVRSTDYGLGIRMAVLSPIALEKEGRKRKENGITTRVIRTWSFIQVLEPPNRA